jgi:hypothetical protein
VQSVVHCRSLCETSLDFDQSPPPPGFYSKLGLATILKILNILSENISPCVGRHKMRVNASRVLRRSNHIARTPRTRSNARFPSFPGKYQIAEYLPLLCRMRFPTYLFMHSTYRGKDGVSLAVTDVEYDVMFKLLNLIFNILFVRNLETLTARLVFRKDACAESDVP